MGNQHFSKTVSKDVSLTTMDMMVLRFPRVAQKIIEQLDNKSLTNCRKVNRILGPFIDDQKQPSVRLILKYEEKFSEFSQHWKKV